jgi:hypothetical protein
MAIFATGFCMAGIGPTFGPTSLALLLPIILAAPIVIRAIQRVVRPDPPGGIRTGRVIMWSTLAETVAILLVVNVFRNVGLGDVVLPGIALVVALHFLPIGWASAMPRFYALAAALAVVSMIGFAVGGAPGTLIAGVGAALALWLAAILALQRPAYG